MKLTMASRARASPSSIRHHLATPIMPLGISKRELKVDFSSPATLVAQLHPGISKRELKVSMMMRCGATSMRLWNLKKRIERSYVGLPCAWPRGWWNLKKRIERIRYYGYPNRLTISESQKEN